MSGMTIKTPKADTANAANDFQVDSLGVLVLVQRRLDLGRHQISDLGPEILTEAIHTVLYLVQCQCGL